MHLSWIRIGLAIPIGFLFLLSACGGGGNETVPGPVASIEVSPSAVLLTATGQSQSLHVRAFDANGTEISMTLPLIDVVHSHSVTRL